jgi:hypothetical protein
MKPSVSFLLPSVTALIFALGVGAAQATVITLDDLTGPSLASGTSEQTVTESTVIGTVTFTGGAILTDETFLPADTTSVYYDSTFLPGTTGQTITITFPQNISNFFLDVYNGETSPDTFTVADNLGNTNTVTLPNNESGGVALVSFPAAGDVVTITAGSAANYDFSIDNIGFDAPTPSVPEPGTWTLLLAGSGLMGAALRRRRSSALA